MSRVQFLLGLARPHRGRLVAAIILTAIATVCGLLPPLALRFLVDHIITQNAWKLLVVAVALVTGLPLWNAMLGVLQRLTVAALGQRLIVDLRTDLYRHVTSLSLRFHGEVGSGLIMNHLMTDVGIVQNLITGEVLSILSSVIALFFNLGMVFYLKWEIGLVLLVILLLYIINYHKFAGRIRSANLELREIMDQVTGRLQERLAGVRLVKTYCRERDETDAFLASTDRALQFGMQTQMLSVSLNASARIIGGIGSTVVYCWCAYFVLHNTLTYGSMTAVDSYLWMTVWPAISLTTVAGTITQATVSLDRILELFSQPQEIIDLPGAVDLPQAQGDLRLDDVHFAYKPEEPLLQGFSLHLPAGKMTALVGHTGCGKTTVTGLLLRLWDVQGGRITLDGHNLRGLTLRSLRWHTGVVPQEPVVFEGTVFDNIAYADPEATPESVEEAARAAQIHDTILTLPDGYRSWLGKEGAKLSVGQKQRIAIARAILRKPAVLILDEATSSLDSESEAALQAAMRVVLHGRTSVVVAHRLSTIVEADQIVAMDKGRIIEIGTHNELMDIEGGYYRRLYEELRGQQGKVANA